jgi:hypothetical protein
MAYNKIFVDNPKCSRRFHVTFDDAGEKLPKVELRCMHCSAVIFEARNHPAAIIAREENLVTSVDPAAYIARKCDFQDKYPPESRHKPL